MTNKEFAQVLEKRTIVFAIEILKLSGSLPNTPESLVLRNQISKSGTSIGANYREANRSRSPKDFKNKIKISLAEASETDYWLEIIEEMQMLKTVNISKLRIEAKELLAIFTSIANKL
ncbi:four helix bundle protein [Algibacter amylolyticus]|uniref:Four helix bundle protein n=1 Tax=Algibacter amylolyticus TaxID=1608400 RepID=A0A5M7AYU6_9FLAO|nr:four helix bundle protein [Algibacter amylolyticus]KAA5822392.1 four helix bundle protein [Algibacter amylolyticus]MBB5269110.1 four helix bundle protein [Algibacter amylolyticus]TSJ73542.1 four helix bundle protein [Algibacter amylolyticus]